MNLPPPKLRELNALVGGTSSTVATDNNVWEIGVPAKNSLYWSILMAYLLSSDDDEFSELIENFKKCKPTKSIKAEKVLPSNANFREIKKKLGRFNPFKNKHVYFYESKVMEAFKLKLNQYGSNMRTKSDVWSDEFKLNAASKMLSCEIQVYFSIKRKRISYPPNATKYCRKIIIFQYEDKILGSRKEKTNVFRFSMTVEHAHLRKILALSHFLKKANLSSEGIKYAQLLMNDATAHGENFIPTLLQSRHCSILPCLYKSPYIALKLSQAGFETNPAATSPEKPSAFLYAAAKTDTKYIRILYDYAANCRYLFESTIRNPNDVILETLERIYSIFKEDRSMINLCSYNINIKERILSIQSEFSTFNKYQKNIASLTMELKRKLQTDPMCLMQLRKEYIAGILKSYTDSFYYDSTECNILEKYQSFLKFSEYYENIDAFTCLSFFDSVFLLKKIFQLKDKDVFAPIESGFFLLIVSNIFFPKPGTDTAFNFDHLQTNSEADEIFRLIPFLQREALNEKIDKFLNEVSSLDKSPMPQSDIKEENLYKSLSSFPEIRDELLMTRIRSYLKAAIGVSPDEDGIKGILVIERALQILGESVKPQSTPGCVVSCLLASQLPPKLKKELSSIRNNFSHFRDNSSQGRLAIETQREYFKNIQSELQDILKRFEVVAFTQYLRLERMLIENSQNEISEDKFRKETVDNFSHNCEQRLKHKWQNYSKFDNRCIELSLDTISNLQEYIKFNNLLNTKDKKIKKPLEIDSILQSIEYIFTFMIRYLNKTDFQVYLGEINIFFQEYRNNRKIASFVCSLNRFQDSYKLAINRSLNMPDTPELASQFPTLLSFLNSVRQNNISSTDINDIIKTAKNIYNEATYARDDLKTYINMSSICMTDKEEKLMDKLLISKDSLGKLKVYFETKNAKCALKELNKKWITIDCLEVKIRKMFEDNSAEDGIVKNLLIKIVYQKFLKTNIYASSKLTNEVCKKLEEFWTKKLNFLLNRIEHMKSVLIEEDEEIESVWLWGRSNEIKQHMKFLMRQRFLREMPVRASLEMAFFDCLNILQRAEFCEMYEKVSNLFTGISLRDVLSHGHTVLETIGSLLDEDDLPSELINKIIELIQDSEAIVAMRDLIPYANTLETDVFAEWIRSSKDDTFLSKTQKIRNCLRWENYLFLLPLI